MDYRLEWFKNCLLTYFGENEDTPFKTLVERNNGEAGKFLNSFLNDEIHGEGNLNERLIFVYKTYYSKMIEEQIEIQEQVSKSRSASLIASSGDDLYHKKKDKRSKKKKTKKGKSDLKETIDEVGSGDDWDEYKTEDYEDTSDKEYDAAKKLMKKSKKKSRKSDNEGGRLSPYTMMQNINYDNQDELDHVSFVTVKKTVQKVIEVPQFNCFYGIFKIFNEKPDENDDRDDDICRHYVYILRKSNLSVPSFANAEETYRQMPSYFLVGSLSANLLNDFVSSMTLVYAPLFKNNAHDDAIYSASEEKNRLQLFEDENVVNEFRNYQTPSFYHRLIDTVEYNPIVCDITNAFADYQNLISNVNLFNVPNFRQLRLISNSSVAQLTNTIVDIQTEIERENDFVTTDVISKLATADEASSCVKESIIESIIQSWIDRINEILTTSVNNYEKSENNLLYEHEYWEQVKIELDRVIDHLSVDKVEELLNMLRPLNSEMFDEYRMLYDSLLKRQLLAAENVTVLRMMKDYFKDLISADFDVVAFRLPQLVAMLQNIWILSKHYSSAENMMRMLERIKWTLCSRSRTVFDVANVFKIYRNSPNVLKKITQDAILMLKSWKSSYLSAKGNLNSFVTAWNFRTEELFSETDYIVVVLDDITFITQFLIEYQTITNSKLKLISNKNDLNDIYEEISDAIDCVEKADFDVYAEIFQEEKQEILDEVEVRTEKICDKIKRFIQRNFYELKDVEVGIEVLEDLVSNKWKFILPEQVTTLLLFDEILSLYSRQISEAEFIFNTGKLNERQPSVQSINWARSLKINLQKAEDKISVFLEKDGMNCIFKDDKEVLRKFADFKIELGRFENSMFKRWCTETKELFKNALKLNLMKVVPAEYSLDLNSISFNRETEEPLYYKESAKISLGSLVTTAKWTAKSHFLELKKEKLKKTLETAHSISWHRFIGERLLIEKGYTFAVNVDDELFVKISEADTLSAAMGFKFPADVRTFLLAADNFKQNYKHIREIVEKYNRIMGDILPAQVLLMKPHLRRVELSVQPAVGRYSWSSLSIDYFVEKSTEKLTEFSYLLSYVQNTLHSLDENVQFIETTKLFYDEHLLSNFFENPVEFEIFFSKTDEHQAKRITDIIEAYERSVSTLVQLEFVILGTNSSSSKCMLYYYDKYEYKLLNVLTKSVIVSLIELNELIDGKHGAKFSMNIGLYKEYPEIRPNSCDLFDRVKKLLRKLFNRLKSLRHWQKNTCLPANEDYKSLYYHDLINNAEIINQTKLIMSSMQNLCSVLTEFTARWSKYANLWKRNKDVVLNKFVSKAPTLSKYELKFDFYSGIINELKMITSDVDSGCVRICQKEIINRLICHCVEWKEKLGMQLIGNTRNMFSRINNRIQNLSSVIEIDVKDEHRLIEVLQAVEDVRSFTYDVERCFEQIREQHHELFLQNLRIPDEDKGEITALKRLWDNVREKSFYRKISLADLKEKLRSKMEIERNNFVESCNELVRQFYNDYPVIEGRDFDQTVELIEVFSEKFAKINSEKQEIDKIQRLFDLHPIDYAPLLECDANLRDLRKLFKQY